MSPFTGGEVPAAAPAPPLPPPPPPPPGGTQTAPTVLPPPPPPRTAPIPPPTVPPAPPPRAPGVVIRPGAPGSDLPALPPAPRGVHFHDGFYLRLALGLGFGGALVSSDSKNLGDYSFSGAGGAADVWIGGTPTPGLAMGGALSLVGLNSARRRVDGRNITGDVSGGGALIGYFVDVFPEPEAGFHFGGALGLASATAEIKHGPESFDGGGFGIEAWAGYDFWVSSQWSLGGAGRFIGTLTREKDQGNDVNYEGSFGAATLSFTALYH